MTFQRLKKLSMSNLRKWVESKGIDISNKSDQQVIDLVNDALCIENDIVDIHTVSCSICN